MLARQHVDAHMAVALERGVHRARTVQADEQRRRRIGDGAHGARGDAAAAMRAGGRDDVHGSAEMRHRLAELLLRMIDVGDVGGGAGSDIVSRRPVRFVFSVVCSDLDSSVRNRTARKKIRASGRMPGVFPNASKAFPQSRRQCASDRMDYIASAFQGNYHFARFSDDNDDLATRHARIAPRRARSLMPHRQQPSQSILPHRSSISSTTTAACARRSRGCSNRSA